MEVQTSVGRLRCEYLVNPLGIDELKPRLSWVMQSERRGARQTAFQIRVASSLDLLKTGEPDLWDSGRIESDISTQVVYEGAELQSRMQCHWKVTVWDESGESTTSEPALWSMGLLEKSDWQAKWITHDPEIIHRDAEAIEATSTVPGSVPLFRKSFSISMGIKRATVYATARGICKLSINGASVTEDQFLPEWTDYHKRLHYRTYDVTDLMSDGENAIGAMLGDGWWSGYIGWQETRGQYGTLVNSLFVQLEVELENGETQVVATDDSWKCETGPILASDFMLGETYDARRDRTGWEKPRFDESSWLASLEVDPPKVLVPEYGFSSNEHQESDQDVPLVALRSEPVRIVERISPMSVNEITPGTFIYDLGQNIAGWVELEVEGAAGTRVQIRHGERLNPDGTLYTENLRRADATDVYILKGECVERWQPSFTFHGFQYIEVTGIDIALPLDKITGCVVMSSTPPAGEFECSHPLVNRLWKNALWGQKGNFLTVPTDCPQRDERLGWMGDAQVFLRTATYNMDVAAFFTKWMTDVTDSQDIDGMFPDVAPRIREGDNFIGLDGLGGSAGWADAGIIVPWTIWRVYGDERILEKHWDSMVHWLDWLEKENPEGIRENKLGNNYGDWLCIPSDTTFRTHSEMKTVLATAYWADDASKMAKMATVLGKSEDANRFTEMHERVRSAFQQKWMLEEGRLAVDTQTAYLLALAFDLLPEDFREQAAQHLVENIKNLDWHLSTGFIGISHLNPILTLCGHTDVAYRLLCNETYPSWLYPVIHGATTIWERWNGWTHEEGFFNPQMNSFNHYSLGSVSEWLYRHVAGIELDPDTPGFKQFVIKPYISADFQYAGGSYDSIHGNIASRWQREGSKLTLEVKVPANTSALVSIPNQYGNQVLESGTAIEEVSQLKIVEQTDSMTTVLVPSGAYQFSSQLPS